MSEKNTNQAVVNDFALLLEKDEIKMPQVSETVKGIVLSASKAEVRLDINGVLMGVVRGRELFEDSEEYANLKPGDEVEATVVELENENGELELSLKFAGQAKAWANMKSAYENRTALKVKIVAANRGGLLAAHGQIAGFIPVSQLAPDNYPRVSGGDKTKILEKLKTFIGTEMEVKVVNLDENQREDKIIFSEKDVWNERQKDVISKYKVGSVIEGAITAITDFGVFVSFGENLEGLIHISELAWQRIDDPADLYKAGDTIQAEIINISGAKIFLSAKKLMKDPWENVGEKYKVGQTVRGLILKVNPFGLFVKLDDEIHGLAHISQLNLAPGQKIGDLFKSEEEMDFTVVSIEPKEHRMGLVVAKEAKVKTEKLAEEKKEERKEENKEAKAEEDEDDKTEDKPEKKKRRR